MVGEWVFRIVLVVMMLGYVVPRTIYRRRAHRVDPESNPGFTNTSESKLRLLLLGVCGLSSDLLSLAWAVNPSWLVWSSLALPEWLRWLGVPAAVMAVWVGYLTMRTLGANYTAALNTKREQRIVMDGIYGVIRHPMYVSFFALLAACFLLTANWLVGLLGLGYSLLIVERVPHEERMMIARFGDEYRAYMMRAGRFFPRLTRNEE